MQCATTVKSEDYREGLRVDREPQYFSILANTEMQKYEEFVTLNNELNRAIFQQSKPAQIERIIYKDTMTYINKLKNTFWNTVIAMITAAAIGIISGISLAGFITRGFTLLNPYLSIFLSLCAIGMFIHAIFCALGVKRRIETSIWDVVKACRRN